MPLEALFTITLLIGAVLAAVGALICRLIMISEVQARLPEQKKIPVPFASWNYFKILRLHRQMFPASRLARAHGFLLFLSLACLGTSALNYFLFH